MSPPVSDLAELLASAEPAVAEGVYVFCHLSGAADPPPGSPWVCLFREREGLTLVLRREDAGRAGLAGGFECAWITLTVHSDLAAVGLTAAVAGALAAEGIPCNVVAGFHHDHLFVPHARREAALAALRRLQEEARPPASNVSGCGTTG